VRKYRTAGRLRVRASRMVKTGKTRKQELEKDRSTAKNAGRLDETKRTGNRQTENTSINTLGIMGKTGNTWRGVEKSTR
jgi:hypothetical protein